MADGQDYGPTPGYVTVRYGDVMMLEEKMGLGFVVPDSYVVMRPGTDPSTPRDVVRKVPVLTIPWHRILDVVSQPDPEPVIGGGPTPWPGVPQPTRSPRPFPGRNG